MKSLILSSIAVGAMVALGGCASSYDIDRVSMMDNQGDAFTTALHKRYLERAVFERGEEDWESVAFFNKRAEMAAMGQVIELQDIAQRALKVDATPIQLASMELSSALNKGAAQSAPDACARAQTWLEHWMEQSEEGHQQDHIKMAREGFQAAMPECQGMEEKPMAAPVVELKPLVVYFEFDSAELSSAAVSQIMTSVETAKKVGVKRAVVIGHTDRSGSSEYNMMLSKKRAEAVANSLMVNGIGAKIDSNHAGETSPIDATEDGVKNRLNRRVEVVYEK